MTRTVNSAIKFPKLNLSLVETIFSSAGEVNESELLRPLQPNTPVRTFTFRGGKRIDFPDTNQESVTYNAPSKIAPGPIFFGKKRFVTTILEDDTRDYCIQPLSNVYVLESSITNVDTGNTMNISCGCLIFVVGTNYTINNIICSENELFAVENNDAMIVASNSCEVYMFRALTRS